MERAYIKPSVRVHSMRGARVAISYGALVVRPTVNDTTTLRPDISVRRSARIRRIRLNRCRGDRVMRGGPFQVLIASRIERLRRATIPERVVDGRRS